MRLPRGKGEPGFISSQTEEAMASLPKLLIFPSWCLYGVKTRDEFSTDLTPSIGSETSNANWSESRYVITLSGGKATDAQNRALKAFNRALQGKRRVCLYRRYDDPEWELKDELIGTGDGVRTVFQAGIYDDVQEKPVFKPVYALDHDIKPIGETAYGEPATKTRSIEVRVNGELVTNGVTIERETGRIVFAMAVAKGAKVTISGGFFVRVRLNQDFIETEPAGAGWFVVTDGIALIEPKGVNSKIVSLEVAV